MHRLVVNPDTPDAWEIALKSGMNFLGSGEENDFPIAHPSVSGAHCEVSVLDSEVSIKDLGSDYGTYLDGQRIGEAVLNPGQTIQLGDVRLRFESDAPDGPPLPPRMPVVPAAAGFCKYHPRSIARFACPSCGLAFCDLCVGLRSEHGETHGYCRKCSVQCTPLELAPPPEPEEEASFWQLARTAFGYPFKGDGVFLLIMGGLLLVLIDGAKFLASYAFVYGLFTLIFLTVFGTGYVVNFLKCILTTSSTGEDKMPEWPDFTDWIGDILVPFGQLTAVVLTSFAPAILLSIFAPPDSPWISWVMVCLLIFGCIYFPMAFTAVAVADSALAVNPVVVIPSIARIPGAYAITIGLLAGVLLIRGILTQWFPLFLPDHWSITIGIWIVANFTGFYLLIVEARILGVLYRTKKEELGWFP